MWTDLGESEWSGPDAFELGLLEPGTGRRDGSRPSSPRRRTAGARAGDAAARRVRARTARSRRARLYATAHGIYEAFVNGERVGDAELTPGVHAVPRRGSRSRPTTSARCCAPGRNAIGAILSDGWFRGQVGLPRAHDQWGSELAVLAELRVEFADGATRGRRHRRRLAERTSAHRGGRPDRRRRPWTSRAGGRLGPTRVRRRRLGRGRSSPTTARRTSSPRPPRRSARSQELAPVSVRRVGAAARCSTSARTSTAGCGSATSARRARRSR